MTMPTARAAAWCGALALAGLLAACDAQPAGDENVATATPTPSGPAFNAKADAVTTGIRDLGRPWSEAKPSDPMRDAKTGGNVAVLTSDGGSAQIFSRPDGNVWQVRLVTGAPNDCGSSAPLIAALPKVAALLKPGFAFTPADQLALGNGMTDLRSTTRSYDAMTVTVVGGCTHWLTIAVPPATAGATPAPT